MVSTPIRRIYGEFAGVDFSIDKAMVQANRSPDALNVWKNYKDVEGSSIQTRPGIQLIGKIGIKILGLYAVSDSKAIVHSGNKLYEWSNFPDEPTIGTLTELFTGMNINNRTSFNRFGDYLYINDGTNYLRYDGTSVSNVSDSAFIPTTTIGRNPSGGGEMYQDVNVLSSQRINQFLADGTSTVYVLDAIGITSVDKVEVDDVELDPTDYSVNLTTGTITFNTAPAVPSLSGKDNVYITFTKNVIGYQERIENCKKALIWDDRIFYTGNPAYPNAIFYSELNDPTYVSDLNYSEDGSNDSAIKDIIVGSNVLWVFKEKDQNNANIFYHTKSIDNEQGKVYPRFKGNVETGCSSVAFNFLDDIVYLSKDGLQGIITTELDSRQVIFPRSHLVNNKLISNTNYFNAQMEEWEGYLLVLVGDEVYLADSRQKASYLSGFEYEWYLWNLSEAQPNLLKKYNNKLYIGGKDGSIYVFDGTNDNGVAIESYWTTPMDNLGSPNHYKTTNKRGGIAKLRTMQNGKVKLSVRTDKMSEFKKVSEKSLQGFNFNNIDFNNFSFTTTNEVFLIFKVKQKKIKEVSLKIYSDEVNKPFGVFSMTLEAFVGGYTKK